MQRQETRLPELAASVQAEKTPNVTPELFICSDTHKRRRQTDRLVLWDRTVAILIRKPDTAARVRLTTLAPSQYQALQTSFVQKQFFDLPARIPSEETCGDDFRITAGTAAFVHTSENDSTESASYRELFTGRISTLDGTELTWRNASLAELQQLVADRVAKLPAQDARGAALATWLTQVH